MYWSLVAAGATWLVCMSGLVMQAGEETEVKIVLSVCTTCYLMGGGGGRGIITYLLTYLLHGAESFLRS